MIDEQDEQPKVECHQMLDVYVFVGSVTIELIGMS
jgi:hypothetical protein